MATFISTSATPLGVRAGDANDDPSWRPNDHNGRPAEESFGLAGFISRKSTDCVAAVAEGALAPGVKGTCTPMGTNQRTVTQTRTSKYDVAPNEEYSLHHLIILWGFNGGDRVDLSLTTEFTLVPLPPAVWAMGAGLGLFTAFGASRRRRAKG